MKNCHYVSSKENNVSMLARLFNHVQSSESSYHNNTYFVKSKLRKINLHNINDHEFSVLLLHDQVFTLDFYITRSKYGVNECEKHF